MNKTLKTVLVSVFGTLTICLIAVVAIIFVPSILSSIRMKPIHEISDAFMTDIKTGDYEGASTFLSQETLKKIGDPNNLSSHFKIRQTIESFERGISMTASGGMKIEVAYGVVYTNKTEGTIWLVMVKNGDTWKITSLSVEDK